MTRGQIDRRRFLAGAGTAATVAAAGCVGGGGASTIQYLSDRGDSKAVIDEIIAEFESESEYTVEVTYTSKGTSTDQQLQKMRAADNPPDVVFDTASDAYRYQRDGNAARVNDTVQGSDLPDPVNVDGDSYFAATMVEPLLGWYRSDLYETEPDGWEAWHSEAARISEETDLDGYTVQSGQTNNADTQMTQYLWQNDVEVYGGTVGDIEVTIDDDDNRQAAVETYEWVQRMAEHSPNGSGWEWGDGIGALQQENTAALMSVGGLPVLTIRENRPELVENLSPTAFPVPEGNSQDQWWAYMEGHVVWSGGDNTAGAREFVDFFSESERFLEFVLSAPLFQFPPTREGLDSDAVKDNEVIQRHQDVMDLIRNSWDAFTTVLATGDDGAANITAADAYGQQLFGRSTDQLLVGDRSPAETVDWVAEELRGLSE